MIELKFYHTHVLIFLGEFAHELSEILYTLDRHRVEDCGTHIFVPTDTYTYKTTVA